MGKGQKIALGIGIAVILAVFVGFLGWQVSDTAYDKCQAGAESTLTCCKFAPAGTVPGEKPYYYWAETPADCTGSLASNAECTGQYYYSEDCNDIQQQWFGAIAVIIGFLALMFGIFMSINNTVEGGLIGGAVICFIMGLVAYWEWLEGWIRVALAGIILLGLIILGIYKMKD